MLEMLEVRQTATMTKHRRCLHCGTNRVARPRGLCSQCYECPSVRLLYPPLGKMGAAGASREENYRAPKKMPQPTKAPPGTPEKVKVLIRRFSRQEWLYHPLDSRGDEEDE